MIRADVMEYPGDGTLEPVVEALGAAHVDITANVFELAAVDAIVRSIIPIGDGERRRLVGH
jgi:hypothetical protein